MRELVGGLLADGDRGAGGQETITELLETRQSPVYIVRAHKQRPGHATLVGRQYVDRVHPDGADPGVYCRSLTSGSGG
jgi:hypothetical protein